MNAVGPVVPEKRAAFEPPARLAEREPIRRRMRRPAATAFGSVLVLLRVIAGVLWLVSLALNWSAVEREFDVRLGGASAAAASDAALAIVLLIGGTVLAIDVVLAVLIWFGSNWARITVMLFATINITIAAIDSFTGDAEVTIRTTFFTVALDILILLALSSRDSRAWARLPRAGRHSAGGRRRGSARLGDRPEDVAGTAA
ncbi:MULTISPECIES: hypothetical protein [unclassified Agromyces]|uniref:hypothetical protein n=1 Tax=unclassified Agromyces TaxID=2639701 RepID=UPI0030151C43